MLARTKLLSTVSAWSTYTSRTLFTSETVFKRKFVIRKPVIPPIFPQDVKEDGPVAEMENPFEREKKKCILCSMNIVADYKNVKLLSQFQSPYTGRVYGRHITGLCKAQQEKVEAEIVKAQVAAMMPTYMKDVEFLKDPKLFESNKPIRPHRF